MPAGNYDIKTEQGTTFLLHMVFQDSDGDAIDLNSYTTGQMQVRRSKDTNKKILMVDDSGVTGGGSTGEFGVIFGTTGATFDGVSGTGSIKLNTSSSGGDSASSQMTGGILLKIDAETMSNIPEGRFLYDIELVKGTNVDRILQGNFDVDGEVTR